MTYWPGIPFGPRYQIANGSLCSVLPTSLPIEVGERNLGLYLEIGLTLLKLGEEARIQLPDFSLEGGARKSLRQHHQRMQRDGCAVEIVPAPEVATLMPELQRISDAWLNEKHTREKGFSLGRFSREYISHFPVVRGMVSR